MVRARLALVLALFVLAGAALGGDCVPSQDPYVSVLLKCAGSLPFRALPFSRIDLPQGDPRHDDCNIMGYLPSRPGNIFFAALYYIAGACYTISAYR